MNQPWVHMCLPILNPPPTSLPTQSFWVVPEHQRWVPCFMHRTCTVHLFYIWYYTSFNAILSNHSTLVLFHIVQNSVLYTCASFAAFPYRIIVTIFLNSIQFSSVQSLSCVQFFATPYTAARQASLSITNSWSLPKPMSFESVMPSNHLILF